MRFYPIAGSSVAFALCYLSLIPGATDGWFFELFGLLLCLLVCWMICVAVRIADRRNGPRPPRKRWVIPLLWGICLTGWVLFYAGIPQRVAFAQHREDLERMIDDKPDTTFRGVVCGKSFGEFQVKSYVADPRGGVYLPTSIRQDGFGPGPGPATYRGFVRAPNPTGTPWGDRFYKLSHVTGDWFEFSALEDRKNRGFAD